MLSVMSVLVSHILFSVFAFTVAAPICPTDSFLFFGTGGGCKKDDWLGIILELLLPIRRQIDPLGGIDGTVTALKRYQSKVKESGRIMEPNRDNTDYRQKSTLAKYAKEAADALKTLERTLVEVRALSELAKLLQEFSIAPALPFNGTENLTVHSANSSGNALLNGTNNQVNISSTLVP